MRREWRRSNDRKVGGRKAQKLWRLEKVGTARRIVGNATKARVQTEVI
jgi:hypothetical protein